MTFVLGVFIGTSLGVFVMSLMCAASRADDDITIRPIGHICGTRCAPLAGLHRSEWS